jgi:hypothetical protein
MLKCVAREAKCDVNECKIVSNKTQHYDRKVYFQSTALQSTLWGVNGDRHLTSI